jgi:hypothetical protein
VIAPLRGLLPLSPLEQFVGEFVTAAVPCAACETSAGSNCDGPVCRPRRFAALERYIAGSTVAQPTETWQPVARCWARLAELDRADQGNSAVIGASGRRCSGINHPSTDAARPALSASCYAVVVGRVPYGPGCTWNCSAHAFSPIKLQLKERDDRRANTEDDTVPTVNGGRSRPSASRNISLGHSAQRRTQGACGHCCRLMPSITRRPSSAVSVPPAKRSPSPPMHPARFARHHEKEPRPAVG